MTDVVSGEAEDWEEFVDEQVSVATLYRIFENNPQQAGRIVTVGQAEWMEWNGHPWPVSGDRSVTQPLRPDLRRLPTPDISAGLNRADITMARWLELWLDGAEEEARNDPAAEVYTGTDRQILRETPAGMRAMVLNARRQQVNQYLIPNLDGHHLIGFTAEDVEALADTLAQTKGRRGANLSRSTLSSVLGHLRRAMRVAYEKELIDTNPAKDAAKHIGAEPKTGQWWTAYRNRWQTRLDADTDLIPQDA